MEKSILNKKQWDSRIKTIATKRLKKFRSALTATSMGSYFNSAIIEYHVDSDRTLSVVINVQKYKELRKLFMDHSDAEMRERGLYPKS